MNQVLDIRRMGYLARRDFINEWRGIAIASGAVAGAMFLGAVLHLFFGGLQTMDYASFLSRTLAIWGIISASLAFTSLHDKTRNEVYLMLPASSFEKTLVRLLWVSLFTPLFIMVMLTLASVFTELVTTLLFQTPFSPLNPFQGVFLKVVGYVVIIQSVFFLGAAWFRKAHFIKTVFTLILLSITLGILSTVFFRLVFASYFEGFHAPGMIHFNIGPLMESRFPVLMRTLEIIGKVLLYGFLAPFCWFFAWLRVKETQSSDGV